MKIVVVGAGHVGRDFAERMHALDPVAQITVIGDEPAYSRIDLVKLLEGSASAADLYEHPSFTYVRGQVTRITRRVKLVFVSEEPIPYDYLVLATGARPIMLPDSPVGVFALRTLQDAEAIASEAAKANSVVIIGGGTLGVETAIALRNAYPDAIVSVLHGANALLERMMDASASQHLSNSLLDSGISVFLGEQAEGFITIDDRVAGIRLVGGGVIAADLVVAAIGVRANEHLACQAGLACHNGVIVDGDGRTNDPSIFAIGDCVAGSQRILATGFRQAEAAAMAIAGKKRERVVPPVSPNRLKTNHKAFSIGRFDAATELVYRRPHSFRKLFLTSDNRLVGAIVFGEWDELPAIEQSVQKGEVISASRQFLFSKFGRSSLVAPKPKNWADDVIVCQCKQVTKGQIVAAKATCKTVEEIGIATGAGTGCSGCKPIIAQLLNVEPVPVKYHKPIGSLATLATMLAVLLVLFAVPYPESFKSALGWLWRDNFAKQVTGYSLLALAGGLAAIGIRKRLSTVKPYDTWKLWHTVLGTFALAALIMHSGGRFGAGLTAGLSVSFLGTALAGGLLAAVHARSHRLNIGVQSIARKSLHWAHVLLLWPFPVLLISHVLQTYLWS